MEIRFIGSDNDVRLILLGWELGEVEIYRQELAYNIWEQRDIFI